MRGSRKRNQTPKHAVNVADVLKEGFLAFLCNLDALNVTFHGATNMYKIGLNGAQEPALFRRYRCSLVIYTTKTLFFPVSRWIHCMRKWDGRCCL